MARRLALLLIILPLASLLWAVPATPYDSSTLIAYNTVLSARQRQTVDLMYSHIADYDYEIDFPSPISRSELDDAVDVLMDDFPELFYLDTSYYYIYNADRPNMITGIEFTPSMSKREAQAIERQLFGDIERIVDFLSGYGVLERELAIYNAVIEVVEYSQEGDDAYTPYGALLYGKAACEGYAEAFCLMLRFAGIPCSVVCGTGYSGGEVESHAWNIVRLGREYTLVDATWDDDDEGASYTYFNIPDEWMERDHRAEGWCTRLPAATTIEYNWHYVNGLVFSRGSDMEALTWSMLDYCYGEESSITVRFEDSTAFRRFVNQLDDSLQSYANEHGSVHIMTSQDDVQLTYTIYSD